MKRAPLVAVFCFLASLLAANAHIGSPNVFFEGNAGPYPVRVIIRPPGVIPGLAEISVRVNTNNFERVLVLPIHWNAGKQGAPRPDEAVLISGETNLFAAQLWFMRAGSESVEVEVVGAAGRGRVMVPVNSIATRVLKMPRGMGIALATFGAVLVLLAASIFGGAVRESVLIAGEMPSRKRIWFARGMTTLTLSLLTAFLWFGNRWWSSEANDYRNNRLFRPVETDAEVANGKLRLQFGINLLRRNGPLVPDHGKLMHLFLVREPGMDVFAHLHPTKVDWRTFESSLPPLPEGDYSLYGDITYETGFSDTLTTPVKIPADQRNESPSLDRDDAWKVVAPIAMSALNSREAALTTNLIMTRVDNTPFVENRDADLRFSLRDAEGRAVTLEPYMGMAAHLIVRREDGSVFTHLHPSGTFSMAAKQLFDLRAEGKAPMKTASFTNEPICTLPLLQANVLGPGNEVSFPYAFPKAGKYRLWVQTKIAGEVRTGVFDVEVAPERRG